MQSHNNNYSNEIVIKTVLLLIAAGLNGIELLIPRIPFFPWFKPGFANIITIIWIVRYGTIDAVLFTLIRSWISGFYFGFSLLAMVLSLSGGIASTIVVGILWQLLGKRGILGTVGLAMTGALIHNATQLSVVYFLFMRNDSIFYQIPLMMIASIVFGGITGLLVVNVKRLLECRAFNSFEIKTELGQFQKPSRFNVVMGCTLILFCAAIVLIDNLLILVTLTAGIALCALFASRKKIEIISVPFRFRYFMIFVILSYLLFSPGRKVSILPFITYEGIHLSIQQMLRIVCWIETGIILSRLKFNFFLFSFFRKLFPANQDTICAGILSVEHFPEIAEASYVSKKELCTIFRNVGSFFEGYINKLFNRIEMVLFKG